MILSNEGRAMYFDGYDFEENDYHIMHISYVANRIVYLDQEVRRTSYYLTDDGYNLILSTLEIENNMKLTIHEMIFQMHLEKQSYDKAVDEITLDGMVSDALSKMTLKEKIGQLFVVCTDSLDFNAETEVTEKMGKNLEEYKPGGVIFFSYNLKNRTQVKEMISDMQKTAEIPLFTAVDEEGGSVARIANSKNMQTTKFPAMAEIGKTGDSKNAYHVGETIGKGTGSKCYIEAFSGTGTVRRRYT